jgi:voltage-gated potassium channel
VTITTVGYGDVTPEILLGRIVAVIHVVVGIALFGVLTAGVAAFFVEAAGDPSRTERDDQLAEVLAMPDAMEKGVEERHL